MADFKSVFKGRRVCALEVAVVVKWWGPGAVSTVSLDIGILRSSWGFGGAQAKHPTALSVGVSRSTGLLTPFRALRVNLTLSKEAKAFSVQVVPGVKPIMDVYSLVTSPPAPRLAFSWASPSQDAPAQAEAALFHAVDSHFFFSLIDSSQFRDAVWI